MPYLVRQIHDHQIVGIFACEEEDLVDRVDEAVNPEQCEWAWIEEFGIMFEGESVAIPEEANIAATGRDDYGHITLNQDAVDAISDTGNIWHILMPDLQGYVYFLRCMGRIKIGSALNVNRRIKQLQTGAPDKVELIGYAPGGSSTERYLHKVLAEHRIAGEWFHGNETVMQRINDVLRPAREDK